MSKGSIKKQLIREAITIYRTLAAEYSDDLPHLYNHLGNVFRKYGWKTSGGAEKFVAIKGSVVAKWRQAHNTYSEHPVRDVYRIYREMNRRDMHSLHPRIYLRESNFYIEQRCSTPKHWKPSMLDKHVAVRTAMDSFAIDIHDGNVGFINNKIKVFDGLMCR